MSLWQCLNSLANSSTLFSYLLFYLYIRCRLSCKIVENLKLWQIEAGERRTGMPFFWAFLGFSRLYIMVTFSCTFGVFSVSVLCILNLKLWQIKAGEGRTKDRYAIPLSMKCHRGTAQLQLNLIYVPRLFLFVFIERWKAITGHRRVIKVSSHFRGPLVLDIIVHICTNKCCLIDLDTIMHMCLDVSKHFSSTTLEKRIE